jgi:hypothetical protein
VTLQSFLIDLILAVIIGVSVYFSARRGGVRTFIEALGFIAAAVLAFTICTPFANATYDKIIEPPILEMVSKEVDANFKKLSDLCDKPQSTYPIMIKNGNKIKKITFKYTLE